jgi:hypothetical protein
VNRQHFAHGLAPAADHHFEKPCSVGVRFVGEIQTIQTTSLYFMASVIRIITSIYFSNGIVLYVQDILCEAVSVLTSYEDGVVILALLKETVEFTSLMQNGAKQHIFFSLISRLILHIFHIFNWHKSTSNPNTRKRVFIYRVFHE